MSNVYQAFVATAEKFPNHIAIVDQEGAITYSELLQQIDATSSKLQHIGIQQGIGVGIICGNNRHFIIALYASIACDALAMPISHQQKPHEITQAIEQAQLHFIIGEEASKVSLTQNEAQPLNEQLFWSPTQQSLEQLLATFIPNAAFMRFTSGTTGKSKGVILSHQSVLERIEAANATLQISPNDKVLWVLSMAYHFIVSIVLYLTKGATIIVNDDFLAERIVQSVTQHKATFFYGSPMHIQLLAAYEKEANLSSLRTVISTTTAISATICNRFFQKYAIPVTQAFGIIEVGLPVINTGKAEEFPDAIGYPLEAYTVEILNEEHQPLPVGEIGLLALKGPGMFDGYLTPETLRKEVLIKEWFFTGDLAVKNEDGLITIKGREKEVINVHGNKVFPTEVEEVLNLYEGITQAKVYGQKHPLLGEMVVADVIAERAFDQEDVIRFCRKKLSSFKVPQKIMQVTSIAMTDSGKIKRW